MKGKQKTKAWSVTDIVLYNTVPFVLLSFAFQSDQEHRRGTYYFPQSPLQFLNHLYFWALCVWDNVSWSKIM